MKRLAFLAHVLAFVLLPTLVCAQVRLVELRLIVVRTEAEAADVRTRIQGGESFESLARTRSVDGSARGGGSLGTIPYADLRAEFQAALSGVASGQITPVFRLGSGYALLQLVAEKQNDPVALRDAVLAGDAARTRVLLAAGADSNLAFDDGSTILMGAAQSGADEIVRSLLEAGARVDARSKDGATALLLAAFEGHASTAKILLAARADANARLIDGSTILMKAALNGNVDIVKALLAAGSDVGARSLNGLTAVMQAAFAGRVDALRVLLEARGDPNATLENGSTALMAAALGGHSEIIRLLLNTGVNVRVTAKNGSTALMEAASAGHIECVRLLLDGSDVNASLANGLTALMGAALGGHTDIVNLLLAAGARVDSRDAKGWTAVTHAAASSHSETVIALLAANAAVNAKERGLLLGGTYVNEYYSSNDPRLLDLASTELQSVLSSSPDNLAALQWMAAVEVLRWGNNPVTLEQYRRANTLLRRCLALNAADPERSYWIAAVNSMFVGRGRSASTEALQILDEGINQAQKALATTPRYWEAMAYLSVLYKQKAERTTAPSERDRLLKLADSATRDSVAAREANRGRPSRPTDQFSTPAPPQPPAL